MKRFFCQLLLFLAAAVAFPLGAHEMRPAYLEITEISPEIYEIVWKVPALGEDQRLSLYVRFDEETETITEPVGGTVGGAHVERWRVKRPGGLSGTPVFIDGLARTFTDVLARVSLADTETQSVLIKPDKPSFIVARNPGGWEVAATYTRLGIEHILGGIDHLLFVLALLLIVGHRWGLLFKTITAFTVAHSITLALATLGFVHVPAAPVEAVIALSIMFVAAEILHARSGHPGLTARAPWVVAFTFGLLHGFGFAGALAAVGLPQNAIPLALLLFNVGVEIGQLLFVVAAIGVITLLGRLNVKWPSWMEVIPPYAIGGMAMFWVIERVSAF
jgi:hypothetical protein